MFSNCELNNPTQSHERSEPPFTFHGSLTLPGKSLQSVSLFLRQTALEPMWGPMSPHMGPGLKGERKKGKVKATQYLKCSYVALLETAGSTWQRPDQARLVLYKSSPRFA